MTHTATESSPGLYLAGQVYTRELADGGNYYDVSLMTSEQAALFIADKDRYKNKACVSLNNIFMPFDTSMDTNTTKIMPSGNVNFTVPSGTKTMIATVGFGETTTLGESYRSEDIKYRNVNDINLKYTQRSIGINKNVLFVGYDDSATPIDSNDDGEADVEKIRYATDISKMVAGPIDMSWSSSKKMWSVSGSADVYLVKCLDGFWTYEVGDDSMPDHYKIRCVSGMTPDDNIIYDDVTAIGTLTDSTIEIVDVYTFATINRGSILQQGFRLMLAIKGKIKDKYGKTIGDDIWFSFGGGCNA